MTQEFYSFVFRKNKWKHISTKELYKNDHTVIHNSHELATTEMYVNWRRNKLRFVHSKKKN